MFIYNAKIYPIEGHNIEVGYVEVLDGKIIAVESGFPRNVTNYDFDAQGNILTAGFIDAHSHIGLIGDGLGFEGEDVNEDSDPVTPHLRTIDGLSFFDGYFSDAIKAGVTTSITGVGSSNAIGGDFIAVKNHGKNSDDMLIKQVGIKFALGENPKTTFSDKDSTPVTRMATAALIRENLFKAKRYMQSLDEALIHGEELPEFDIKLEALLPLLRREIKAYFHCHRADDIMTAVRISKEFSLDYVLIHCTEGYLIADSLAEAGAKAVLGPIICDRGKPELAKLSLKNASVLVDKQIPIAICTDHPETPVNFLATSTAYCIKNGLSVKKALEALTINAAELNGISDRVGSVVVGKDADLVIFDGSPFDVMTEVMMTMVNGEIV